MDKAKLTEIIKAAQTGDNTALETLYREYVKSVYYLSLKLLKNKEDAEDITQEVFIYVYQKIGELQTPEAFTVWLGRITTNKATDFLRKKRRLIEVDVGDEELAESEFFEESDPLLIPEKYVDNAETARMIVDIIDNLPLPQRLCIYYYYYEHLTVAQIAENLETNENTVKTRLSAARAKIRKELERLNEDEGIKLYSFVPLMLTPILKLPLQNFEMPHGLTDGMLGRITAANVKGAIVMGAKVKIAMVLGGIVLAGVITAGVLMASRGDNDRQANAPPRQTPPRTERNTYEENYPDFNADNNARLSSRTTELINPDGGDSDKMAFPVNVSNARYNQNFVITVSDSMFDFTAFTPNWRALLRNNTISISGYEYNYFGAHPLPHFTIEFDDSSFLPGKREINVYISADSIRGAIPSLLEDGNWFMRYSEGIGYVLFYRPGDMLDDEHYFRFSIGDDFGTMSEAEIFAAARNMFGVYKVGENYLSGTDENGNTVDLSNYTFINDAVAGLIDSYSGITIPIAKEIISVTLLNQVKVKTPYPSPQGHDEWFLEYTIEFKDSFSQEVIDRFNHNGVEIEVRQNTPLVSFLQESGNTFCFVRPGSDEYVAVTLSIPSSSGELSIYKEFFLRDFG